MIARFRLAGGSVAEPSRVLEVRRGEIAVAVDRVGVEATLQRISIRVGDTQNRNVLARTVFGMLAQHRDEMGREIDAGGLVAVNPAHDKNRRRPSPKICMVIGLPSTDCPSTISSGLTIGMAWGCGTSTTGCCTGIGCSAGCSLAHPHRTIPANTHVARLLCISIPFTFAQSLPCDLHIFAGYFNSKKIPPQLFRGQRGCA